LITGSSGYDERFTKLEASANRAFGENQKTSDWVGYP
jgi:hypothetical protein